MAKDTNISFRVSLEERERWNKFAASIKMTTSGWMRRTLNAASVKTNDKEK